MRPVIYLDVDGVLADYVAGVCALLGLDRARLYQTWQPGVWHMTIPGVPDSELTKALARAGSSFWEELPELPQAGHFVEWLRAQADVVFCTAPARGLAGPGSIQGKHRWLSRRWPDLPILYCQDKSTLAANVYAAALIDDRQENVDRFQRKAHNAGSGDTLGLLVPQRWNRMCASATYGVRALMANPDFRAVLAASITAAAARIDTALTEKDHNG